MDKAMLAKIYLPINLYTPLFCVAMYVDTAGPGANALLPINLCDAGAISVILLLINILVVKDLLKGSACSETSESGPERQAEADHLRVRTCAEGCRRGRAQTQMCARPPHGWVTRARRVGEGVTL